MVWVLVCDAAKARLFEAHRGNVGLQPLELQIHGESRSRASALVSDREGSRSPEGGSAQGRSVHHNGLAPRSAPKEIEKEHFARALMATLDQAVRAARFESWILVAPPHFLGLMRKALTGDLRKRLAATIDKDLNELDAPTLSERLHDTLMSVLYALG